MSTWPQLIVCVCIVHSRVISFIRVSLIVIYILLSIIIPVVSLLIGAMKIWLCSFITTILDQVLNFLLKFICH